MTDPVLYTQLVRTPSYVKNSDLRRSFIDMGFSIRTYFLPQGSASTLYFYVDYTSVGHITLWLLRYGATYPDVVFSEIVYADE
jgi:hypothetical protein